MESTGQISTDEIKTLNVKRKIKIILLGKFYKITQKWVHQL